jgi:hypothetical protein
MLVVSAFILGFRMLYHRHDSSLYLFTVHCEQCSRHFLVFTKTFKHLGCHIVRVFVSIIGTNRSRVSANVANDELDKDFPQHETRTRLTPGLVDV